MYVHKETIFLKLATLYALFLLYFFFFIFFILKEMIKNEGRRAFIPMLRA